jgi:hypothetical protein
MLHVHFSRRFVASFVTISAILLSANAAFAQSSEGSSPSGPFYQPVSPYPVELGFVQHHASTAAEGYLRGKAAVIQALGSFELSASQAAILRQQARALDRENDLLQTQALHAQKKMWADARAQERNERNSQLAAGRQVAAQRQATEYRNAYQLSADDVDLITGDVRWPAALQCEIFAPQRVQIEQLLRQYLAYGDPQPQTAAEIARTAGALSQDLRRELTSVPREEYLAAQKFLMGLKYSPSSISERVAQAQSVALHAVAGGALANQ